MKHIVDAKATCHHVARASASSEPTVHRPTSSSVPLIEISWPR